MDTQGTSTSVATVIGMLVVLGLVLPLHAAQAGNDRIFADGFDPCCQIGGTVSGLAGSGLVLHLDAGAISEDRPVTANGLYQFAASVPTGTAYSLSFTTQPSGQTCTLSVTNGTIGSADIDNANVTCGDNLIWNQGDWGEPWQ